MNDMLIYSVPKDRIQSGLELVVEHISKDVFIRKGEKRRWKMEYIRNIFDPTDKKYSKQLREAKIPNTEITWEQFVTEINKKLFR